MGSAMGSLLHQRNILPLHASAVETNGEGVLFLGPSSIGKSTLAAGFGKRGRRLLADDVCAVTAKNGSAPSIIPGFPRLKLWHDALKKLKHGAKGLHRVRLDKDFKKYFVPFGHADNTPAPVRSIFILDKTNTDRFEAVQLKGVDKISPLITNTYRPRFLEGLGGKQEHFKQCAAVADKAVVTRITRPQQRFLLDELMDLVERYW
jgi:hypothetical protein